MASWDDVRRAAGALPEVRERAGRAGAEWRVRGRLFAWERPLRRPDRAHLGDAVPEGPILAVHVPDLTAKEGLVEEPGACFTTPHFDGHPIALVRLGRASPAVVEELVAGAWLARAPKRLAAAYLDGPGQPPAPSSASSARFMSAPPP